MNKTKNVLKKSFNLLMIFLRLPNELIIAITVLFIAGTISTLRGWGLF